MTPNMYGGHDITIEGTIEFIDKYPTAYDVEAVVKQIEEFYPDAEHYGFSGAITDIIEIVRNGGVK